MAVIRVPFDIDEAKLTPPVLRPASVKKADAISALLASSAPIATVTAPAGYGKTTLLGRWAEVDPRGFAWVSLDARDDDELVFLRGIAAAIHRVEPIAKSVFDALSGPGGSIWNRVPRVGNAFAALTRPIVVALDDLHAVTSPSCLSVLAALVDYVPPGSQVVVTSREKPALPLARWRSRGLLLELGTEDLRLEPWEADLLLRGASVALEAADVAALTQQTEGWPAGLYLAALSFRSGAPDLPAVKAIAGDDRFVSEYFRQEVMSRLPMSEAQFAMRTSVLDTLNGSLCDAVLETQGSAQVLDALERSNRFVVPLDNRGEQYRYHHLFRQLLRLELERREPQLIDQLNRRAMAWYTDHDQPERAVAFGQAANATTEVATLVDQVALPLHYDGRMSTLEELLDWFDADDMTRFPAIAVYAAWVRAMTGRASEASRYLSIADGTTSSVPLSDGSSTIEPWVATLRAAMMPHGVDSALVDAETALAEMSASSAWRSDATLMRGIARALLGSIDDAVADLHAAHDLALAAGAVDTQFTARAELALLDARRGSWFEAQRHADEARAVVEQAHLEHYGLAAIAHVAVARVAIHRHHHGDARAAMTRAHKLRPLMDHALPWLTVQVGIELTRAHLALGEVDAARAILDETSRVLARRPNLGTLVDEVREMRALVAASSGEGAWAVNLTAAELRLLPYLATYLTFPEVAGQLFITSHTVRSQAKAIYRKLDATSRTEAIERAVDVGLLEPMFPHRASVAS